MRDGDDIFARAATYLGRVPQIPSGIETPKQKRPYHKSPFLLAKRHERDMERWEAYERRREAREKRAKDRRRDNRSEWMRDYFREQREDLLDAVCPERHCMCCLKTCSSSRQLCVVMVTEIAGRTDDDARRVRDQQVGARFAVCLGCKRTRFRDAVTVNR